MLGQPRSLVLCMVALSLSLLFSSRHTVAAVADDLWALDPSYGRDGVMQFKPSAWTAAIDNYRSSLLGDGRLIVALETIESYGRGSNPWWGTAIFTSSGELLAKLNLETVGVQSDGKLLTWYHNDDGLTRYFPNGERDADFVALSPSATNGILLLAVASDDSILYSYDAPHRIARLQPDGRQDLTFSAMAVLYGLIGARRCIVLRLMAHGTRPLARTLLRGCRCRRAGR